MAFGQTYSMSDPPLSVASELGGPPEENANAAKQLPQGEPSLAAICCILLVCM